MVAIAAVGYILGVFGPYEAKKKNDASIMNHILTNKSQHFKRVFKPSDVFIVDRGFRDANEVLKNSYKVAMPVCVPLKQSQLTSLQANQTRLVTKVRYKIEVVNGILKRNKLLNNKRFNSTLPDGLDDWKIAVAIFNEFFIPIESDQESSILIAQRMRALLNTDCKLLELVPQLDR